MRRSAPGVPPRHPPPRVGCTVVQRPYVSPVEVPCTRSRESSPAPRASRSPSRRSTCRIPGPGEALVQVQACGVCHTDLHYREGGINDDFPFLLGHEAAGVVEAVGDGVTVGRARRLRRPQLARRLRQLPRLHPRRAVVLLRHPQRHPEDDPRRRHGAVAGARHRRVRREDAGRRRPVHQGRPVGARRGRRPARLRRDGRARRGHQHRQRRARQERRGDRLRRRRRGRDRRARRWPAPTRSSPSTSTTGSSTGATKLGATHTVTARTATRSRRSRSSPDGNGADVVIDAVGRPETWKQAFYARDLAGTVVLVGVPTPDMRHPRHPADRRLRPRRRAQVELVRRLPAEPRLPDAGRPVPAGPARPRRVRLRGDRARRRRGGVREDAPRRRAALACVRSLDESRGRRR